MKILIISVICSLFFFGYYNNNSSEETKPSTVKIPCAATDSMYLFCSEYNLLNDKIRDSKISTEDALKLLQVLMTKIKSEYYKNGGKDHPLSEWCFPVKGYSAKTIGGRNGSGYIASGFNYLDGKRHVGHPAQDIFIVDKNMDCVEDYLKKPINVLSMTGGVVVAFDTSWAEGSSLRGGKYVWVYDPFSSSLFYYAHNDKVFVNPGQLVKPGDSIATVGRTGLNADKKRSPTHLHFMWLKLGPDFYPRPVNPYQSLVKAKLIK